MLEIYCTKCKRVHNVSKGFATRFNFSQCPWCSHMCSTGVAQFEAKEYDAFWRKNSTNKMSRW